MSDLSNSPPESVRVSIIERESKLLLWLIALLAMTLLIVKFFEGLTFAWEFLCAAMLFLTLNRLADILTEGVIKSNWFTGKQYPTRKRLLYFLVIVLVISTVYLLIRTITQPEGGDSRYFAAVVATWLFTICKSAIQHLSDREI